MSTRAPPTRWKSQHLLKPIPLHLLLSLVVCLVWYIFKNWQDSPCSSWPPLWTHVPGIPWHNIKVHILTNRIDCNTDAYSIMFHKEIRKVWAWTTCAQHFLMEHYTQVLGYVSWFVYYVFNFGLHERDTHHYGTLCMYVDLFVLLSYTGPNCHRTLQDT